MAVLLLITTFTHMKQPTTDYIRGIAGLSIALYKEHIRNIDVDIFSVIPKGDNFLVSLLYQAEDAEMGDFEDMIINPNLTPIEIDTLIIRTLDTILL